MMCVVQNFFVERMISVAAYLLKGLLHGVAVTTSIGLADSLELYINPQVHEEHNCYVVRVPWKDYTVFDAFWSGVKVSWSLIIPTLIVLPTDLSIITSLCLLNMAAPLIALPFQRHNTYFAHELLYAINPVFLLWAVLNVVAK